MSTKRISVGHEIPTYLSYRFIDKDPMIDKLRTALQRVYPKLKDGKATGAIDYEKTSVESGVHSGTYRNWFEKGTKRPQGATMIATAKSMPGWDMDLLDPEEVEMIKTLRKRRRAEKRAAKGKPNGKH